MNEVSWGLDLAGFSTGKSALARAVVVGPKKARIEVYASHPFMRKIEGRDTVGQQLEDEKSFFQKCRPLYIDMPIDLQGLPSIQSPVFSWQLTKRAIDFAYSAMPPLADRIGSPVARLQALLPKDLEGLDVDYFETYPAMSLYKWFGNSPASYKSATITADWDGDRWVGDSGLAELMNRCRFKASGEIRINDDQFDASVCAIVGIVESEFVLSGDALDADIGEGLFKKIRKAQRQQLRALDLHAPKGYRILKMEPTEWEFEIAMVDSEVIP